MQSGAHAWRSGAGRASLNFEFIVPDQARRLALLPRDLPRNLPKMSGPAAHLSAEAKANLPKHVAVIMDGNGRWAKQRHLPRVEGHPALPAIRTDVESLRLLAP